MSSFDYFYTVSEHRFKNYYMESSFCMRKFTIDFYPKLLARKVVTPNRAIVIMYNFSFGMRKLRDAINISKYLNLMLKL